MRMILLLTGLLVCTVVARSEDDDLSAETKVLIAKFKEDLKNKVPATRAAAYKTIAELSGKAKSERRAMCEGMLDTAPFVRTAAADCLKKVDEKTYKLALAIYINKDAKAVGDAQKLGKEAAPVVPLLLKIAGDLSVAASNVAYPNRDARAMLRQCVYALCAIDPEDNAVNQAVLQMLSNPVPEMRSVAVNNVPHLKNKKLALNGLAAIAANPKDEVVTRTYAISLIPGLTDENTSANAKMALETLRFDDVPAVREAVESAMKIIK